MPNDRKLDYDVDEWIEHPPKKDEKKGKKKPAKTKKSPSILDISKEVEFFCSNAYAQNYLLPNHAIPKNERPKWRFVVKRLYNQIQSALDSGNQPAACTVELEKLYKVLTYACNWQIFSAYDPFESAGIEQTAFFNKIVTLYRNHFDFNDFIGKSIRLIIDNPLNRYTLYSELIEIFISYCNTNDLLNLCFQQTESLRPAVLKEPNDDLWNSSLTIGNKNEMSYKKKTKLNNLTEIGFKIKVQRFEVEKAIEYFNEHHIQDQAEVKLYILVSLLFAHGLKDHIVQVIESNQHMKPRKSLVNLATYITTHGALPDYLS